MNVISTTPLNTSQKKLVFTYTQTLTHSVKHRLSHTHLNTDSHTLIQTYTLSHTHFHLNTNTDLQTNAYILTDIEIFKCNVNFMRVY